MDSGPILDAFCLRVSFRTCESKDYIWKANTKSRSRPSKIDQKSKEKRYRNPEALFVDFLIDLASILTSNLEPFGHRGPSKNVSKIRPRKRAGWSGPCGCIPVAPLPPITCSGKPAPKSDKGNICADDELESKVGEHKNSAWDLLRVHAQCNEIHSFR